MSEHKLPREETPDATLAADLEAEGFEEAAIVGRGGFGVVLRCLQRSLDRPVAVKVLTTELNPDNLERFLREQRAMGRLSGHPNIVNIHHYGTTRGGRPYIVMQYHPQGSLESRIQKTAPLDWRDALELGVKMAGALETAHTLGMLHRDMKPANILLTDYGEPQLTDFGIAHVIGGFETETGIITGSPAYTAPEILKGQPATPRSDIYSLGATLFCAITGHAAFERREGEKLVAQFVRVSTQPIPDLRKSGLPADVSAAIEHAMAATPTERPSTAELFGEELQAVEKRNNLTVVDMALPARRTVENDRAESAEVTRQTPGPAEATAAVDRHIGNAITPPTPSTKYRPPSPNRPLVARGRLVDVLTAGKGKHLTVIHAPAGYGKTTLATQWRDILVGEGGVVAWLSVDPDDNNVVWFLSHLVESIRQVRPTLARELGQTLEEHGDQAERYVLSTLINEIHGGGEPVGVVIDDWHRVTSKETHAAMDFLLDNCCHHLQVIVTSRTRSGLPLSRMKVRNELLEIDAAALRFDPTESRTFLVDLGGLSLGQGDVENLTSSTDGWVAALQLASLSLRECDDPTQMIGSLSGRHHAIGEFLAENVLDILSPELLDFLTATSITGRICGSLASALAQVQDGQDRLEDVERRDLFLRRIDDDGDWFRYHHLFAEFLRRRLERDHSDRIVELHRAASLWFAEHRLLSEAVDHALCGGDEDVAVTLVERNQTYLLEHSQMSTLLGLVAKLPPLLVAESAPLQLAIAWANILLQRSQPAKLALQRILPSLERSALSQAERESVRIEALVAEAVLDIHADRIDRVPVLVEEALAQPENLRPWAVSVAANVQTFVEMHQFNYDAVPRLQTWARTYHARTNGPFSVMYGYAFAGLSAYEQLEIDEAELQFTSALRVARNAGGPHSHAARLAGALLGELKYEQGHIDDAERLIDESYQLGAEGGEVDYMIPRFVVGARIKAVRGDIASATKYLQEGSRAADSLSLRRLRARIDNERLLLHLPVDSAAVPLPDCPPDTSDGLGQAIAQLEEDTAIRILLARQSPGDTARAVARAQQWDDVLSMTRCRRAALRATRLLVSCLTAAGRVDDAKAALARAAAICATRGILRTLLDGGEDVAELLRELREDQRSGRWNPNWHPVPQAYLDSVASLSSE
jgi:ATP/maltotriose-dependent transcriptional regulator MalT